MFLRPSPETPEVWEEKGFPFFVAALLDALWTRRALVWTGLSNEDFRVWGEIWNNASGLSSVNDVRSWAASVRELLWGDARTWSERTGSRTAVLWRRANLILGLPLLRWIANDGWAYDAERWGTTEAPRDGYMALRRWSSSRLAERRIHITPFPAPVDPLDICRKAEEIKNRFGLTSISSAADMTPQEVMTYLMDVEEGLKSMAYILQWPEECVGAGRIGLSFELEAHSGAASSFDHLTKIISLGRSEGWGSFAHEWAHALDACIGDYWKSAGNVHGFASEIAEDPCVWLSEPHRNLRQHLASRDMLPRAYSASLKTHRRILDSVSSVMADMGLDIPSSWSERFGHRLRALGSWIELAHRPLVLPEKLKSRWDQWRLGNKIAWSYPLGEGYDDWRRRWEILESQVDKMLFDSIVTRQSWAEWAYAHDAVNSQQSSMYRIASPSERFSRSFHAYIRSSVGKDSWLAGPAISPSLFPVGTELAQHKVWWPDFMGEAREIWELSPLGF